VYGFPRSSTPWALLSDLLDQAFTGSRFAQPPWVRCFTSGTQVGSPIDRVMGSMARLRHRALGAATAEEQRAQLLPDPIAA
jgi:type VI protein secretion system component VasK